MNRPPALPPTTSNTNNDGTNIMTPDNMTRLPLEVGAFVRLHGLQHAVSLNGRRGAVIELRSNGRVVVHLFPKSKNKAISVKAANLTVERRTTEATQQARRKEECHSHACPHQSSESEKMMACSRCKIVFYCCKNCQVQHWSIHKKVCQQMRQAMLNEKKGNFMPTKIAPNATRDEVHKWLKTILGLVGRLVDKKKFAAAEKILKAAIDELKPNECSALYSELAFTMSEQQRGDEAVAAMATALEVQRKMGKIEAGTLRNMALSLEQQGDYEQSLEYFERAIQMDSINQSDSLYHIAMMYLAMDRLTDANQAFERLVNTTGPVTHGSTDIPAETIVSACYNIAYYRLCAVQDGLRVRWAKAETSRTTISRVQFEKEINEIQELLGRVALLAPYEPKFSGYIEELKATVDSIKRQNMLV